jgi:hypothetical protein
MKVSLFITVILCAMITSVCRAQNATIRIRNVTPYSVDIILEGSDDPYQGCSPTAPATYCSWIQSNAITIPAFTGWVTYTTPTVIECSSGWANCTFTGYGACAGTGSMPALGSWTTIWRNARISINPSSGCSPSTTCVEDPLYGTFGGTCTGTFITGCSNFVTWTRVTAFPFGIGDQIDIQIY